MNTNEFEGLNYDDVVSVQPDTFADLDISRTFRVIHLLEAIQECFNSDTGVAALFAEGVNCEVLRLGAKAWQKGKMRILLEFCPDRPNNPTFPPAEILQQLKAPES